MTQRAESLGDWLDGELARAPQELAVRVRNALPEAWRSAPLASGSAILANAAAAELRDLLERGCDTRWAAPGLLTVDALVTYACQLLTVTGADIDSATMSVLSTIVRESPNADLTA